MDLNQVTLPVRSVPESISFYKKLGLILIVHTHGRYARFMLPNGNSTLSIHESSTLNSSIGGIQLYFECEDLEDKVEELIDSGIEFTELPNDKPWLWKEAHLNDPDGNHLVLFRAGENRKDPPWRINSE